MRAFSTSGGDDGRPGWRRAASSHVAEVSWTRRAAVVALGLVHILGALGAPLGAALDLWQPGATPFQTFHVVWEASKHFAASVLAAAVALVPLARGERWAFFAMLVATLALFGGVFLADGVTSGAPPIDLWLYGGLLLVSGVALWIVRPPATPLS